MVNSAIEACVDLETTRENSLAKIAKDCASGASLVLCTMSLFVAGIIFIPKIIALF
jgi:diacylglycerol kinase